MKSLILSLLILALAGCTTSYPLKSVDYNDLFTDGNSKIWIVNKQIVNGVNVAPHELWSKDVMVFHKSGVVDYISLKSLGHKDPVKGRYYLDSDAREMSIEFEGETWAFDLPTLLEDRVFMSPEKGSDAKFKLELKPLPEL